MIVTSVLLLLALVIPIMPSYAADPAAGKKLSAQHCAKCHGDTGKGDESVICARDELTRPIRFRNSAIAGSSRRGTKSSDTPLGITLMCSRFKPYSSTSSLAENSDTVMAFLARSAVCLVLNDDGHCPNIFFEYCGFRSSHRS